MTADDLDLTARLVRATFEPPQRGNGDRPAGEPRLLASPKKPTAVARQLIAEQWQGPSGELLLRRWRGGWWTWGTSHWAELEEAFLKAVLYAATEHARYSDEKGKVQPWAPTRYRLADLADALAALCHLPETTTPPAWTDGTTGPAAGELVACANGLLHVPTRTLHEHRPGYFNQVAVPFAYEPDADTPERWLRFLGDLWDDDPDTIAALQEWFGYVISGRLDLHKIMLLVGPTRAGKGVIARVLRALVGKGHCAGPTLASLGTNFGLQPLIGKPLAVISDARLGGVNVHQVVERLLSISGEDALTIDRKYLEPWTGTLPTRFLLLSNELPRFGDASGAIANRFVIGVLSRSWLGRENTRLTGQLLEELPGILNWALDGLDRLNEHGHFTEPSASRDAVVALADLVSPVAAFVRDRCQPSGEVPVDDIYGAWRAWADEHGHRPGSAATFGRDLRAVLPGVRKMRPREGDGRVQVYQGVSLATAHNGRSLRPPVTGPTRSDGTDTTGALVTDGHGDRALSAQDALPEGELF